MVEEEEHLFRGRERQRAGAATSLQHSALMRTLLFAGFTLVEYIRSGRIWVEIGATTAFYVVFLRGGDTGIEAEKFFSITGIFTLALTIYTMSSVMSMGDRPQGYLVLARRVGRAGYILGFYLSGLLVIISSYLFLSLFTAALSRFVALDIAGWILGTLPLLLNVGLLAALLLLLAPLVLDSGWRLLVLGLIALAFSGNFLGNATMDELPGAGRTLLNSLQTLLSYPMVPAFSGFALSLSRDYSGNAPIILVAQFSLLVALLGLALFSFSRRELILHTE